MTSLQNDLQFMQHERDRALTSHPAPENQYHFFGVDGYFQEHDLSAGTMMSFAPPPASSPNNSSPPGPAVEASFSNFVVDSISSSSTRSPDVSSRLRSGHRVPRPRNAFMIFRSEFWAEQKINRTVEHDHRHISRIIGHYWNNLSETEKDIWRHKADQEKLEHAKKYPDYRFTPGIRAKPPVKRNVKRNGADELSRCRQVAELLLSGKEGEELTSAVEKMEPISLTEHGERPRPLKRRRKTSSALAASESSSPDSPCESLRAASPEAPAFRSPLLPPAERSDSVAYSRNLPQSSISHYSYIPPTQQLPSDPQNTEDRPFPHFPPSEVSLHNAYSFQRPTFESQLFKYGDYLHNPYPTPEPIAHSYCVNLNTSSDLLTTIDSQFLNTAAPTVCSPSPIYFSDAFASKPAVYESRAPPNNMPRQDAYPSHWYYSQASPM